MIIFGKDGQVEYERNVLCIGRRHVTDKAKTSLPRTNTDIVVIPGGFTSILQSLDIAINKPFEDKLREEWNSWMMDGGKSYTNGGAMRAAPLDILCE